MLVLARAVGAVCLFTPRPARCKVILGWGVSGDTGPGVASGMVVGVAADSWESAGALATLTV